MFGDKSKRAEKKAKREQAKIKAKENPVILSQLRREGGERA
jgi:hypothetical protein